MCIKIGKGLQGEKDVIISEYEGGHGAEIILSMTRYQHSVSMFIDEEMIDLLKEAILEFQAQKGNSKK